MNIQNRPPAVRSAAASQRHDWNARNPSAPVRKPNRYNAARDAHDASIRCPTRIYAKPARRARLPVSRIAKLAAFAIAAAVVFSAIAYGI